VKGTLREPSGRVVTFAPQSAVASDNARICGTEATGRTRCFHTGSGEEIVFTNVNGNKTEVKGWERLDMGDALLCGSSPNDELQCYVLPLAPGTPAARITLLAETGRPYDTTTLRGVVFAVEGRHVCLAAANDKRLLCFNAQGQRLNLKNTAGFSAAPDASSGLRLSPSHACALNGSQTSSCFALASGELLSYRNELGFAEVPPSAQELILGAGSELCFLPLSPGPACFTDGKRIIFKDRAGRNADVSKLAQPHLKAGRFCGVEAGGKLGCFDTSTGRAVTFTNQRGLPDPLDATRGVAHGADGVCTVSATREARCARHSGEALAFSNRFGGQMRIEGVEQLRTAQ
jgi:hypothetical protein